MVAAVTGGPLTMSLERDNEGHRNYSIMHLVKTTSYSDGPYQVMNAAGLPAIGSIWNFGNDVDQFAFCYPDMRVNIAQEKRGEKTRYWTAEQKFSTKPLRRCQDQNVEDPLLEPAKVSGSFSKYTREVTKDRHGDRVVSSSHEMFRGTFVEFDHNRPTVRIEQNLPYLGLNILSQMVDTVNINPLWGLGPRKIKLSNISWERVLFGTCNFYYMRTLEFEIDFNGWDRKILDQGTKALRGVWVFDSGTPKYRLLGSPDKDNPSDFSRYKDASGEITTAILDGQGLPAKAPLEAGGTGGDPHEFNLEYYPEFNFLMLGIPTEF